MQTFSITIFITLLKRHMCFEESILKYYNTLKWYIRKVCAKTFEMVYVCCVRIKQATFYGIHIESHQIQDQYN